MSNTRQFWKVSIFSTSDETPLVEFQKTECLYLQECVMPHNLTDECVFPEKDGRHHNLEKRRIRELNSH